MCYIYHDRFKVAWYIQDNYEYIAYTLSGKYIGGEGFMVSPPHQYREKVWPCSGAVL